MADITDDAPVPWSDEPITASAPTFKRSPLAMVPADLDDADERQDGAAPPGLLAHHATSQPQAQAAQTLALARSTGTPAPIVAADPQEAQRRAKAATVAAQAAASPALAGFMDQSPEHAAVVQDEAENLGFLTRWLGGIYPQGTQYDPDSGMYLKGGEPTGWETPPVVASLIDKAITGLHLSLEGFKLFALKADTSLYEAIERDVHGVQPGATPDDIVAQQKVVDDLSAKMNAQTPLEKATAQYPQKLAVGALQLPAVALTGGAGFFIQAAGDLTAQGVDPGRAAVGGAIYAVLGKLTGYALSKSFAPLAAVEDLSKTVAGFGIKQFFNQAIPDFLEKYGKEALTGLAAMAGMSFSQKATLRLDRAYKTGRDVDPSEYSQDAAEAIAEAVAFLPLHGAMVTAGLLGRHLEAHGNGVHHDVVTGSVQDSKVPPDELKDLINRSFAGSPLPRLENGQPTSRFDQPEAPRIQFYGPNPPPTDSHVYIDPEHFEKVMRAAGENPETVASAVAEGSGFGWRHSKLTGDKLKVPIADYLTTLAPWHEQLRDGVSLTGPKGATLSQNDGQWLTEESARAQNEAQGPASPTKPLAENPPTKFTTEKGSTYTVNEKGQTQRDKALHQGHDPNDVGVKELSERTVYVDPTDAREIGMHGTITGQGATTKLLPEGVELVAGRWRKVITYTDKPEIGRSPIEFWSGGKFHAGNKIVSVESGGAKNSAPVEGLGLLGQHIEAQGPASPTPPQTPASKPTEFKTVEPGPLGALKARVEVEPTAKGLKTYATAAVQEQTINDLEQGKGRYTHLANEAQKQADKLSSKTIDLLASAEQSAQQGIDAAVQSTETAQGGIVASEAARRAPEILQKAIRKIVSQGRMAGIDPGAISDEVNKVVQSAITKEAGKALKANVTPAQIQSIVKAEVTQARKAFADAGRGATKAQDQSEIATEKTVRAGDNAQQIKELQQKRDLNNAMEAARAKAVQRSDQLTKRLVVAASNGARDSLYKGRGAFGGAHDLLMEALNLRTPDNSVRPPDFETAAAQILQSGNLLDFEVGPIQDLVQNPRPIGDLKPAELENVVRASDNLRHLAGEAAKTYVDGKLEDRAKTIAERVAPGVLAGARNAGGEPPTYVGKAWEAFRKKFALDKLDAFSSNFHTLLQPLGDWGRSQEERFLTVRRNRDVLTGEVHDVYKVAPELMARGDEDVPHPDWMPENAKDIYGEQLKRRDVWRVAQTAGTREGVNALASSWDESPEQISQWLNDTMNTKEEWDHVADRWRLSAKFGDMERAADSNRGGVPMVMKTPRTIQTPFGEYEGGYAPIRWHDKGNALPAKEEVGDTSRGINATRDTEHGFTKTQQEGVKGVIDISADNLPAHYRALVNDISLGDFVRDQSRMLLDPAFKAAVAPLGPDYYKALTAWHNTVATGQVQNVTNSWYREGWVARSHGLAARAVFNLNLRVMAGLGGHLPFAKAVEGSGIDIASGIGSMLTPEKYAYGMANSKVLPYRNERWFQKYNDLQDTLSNTQSSGWDRALSAPSVALWHGADMGLANTIWHGLHDAAQARGLDPKAAITHADVHTDRLMPAIDIYGKSLRATDPILGMMMMAKNYESTVWNVKAMREWDTRAGTLPDGTGRLGSNTFAWKLGVAGALGLSNFVLLGHGRNQEEQKNGAAGWAQFAGRSLLEGGLYGNMLTHMVANQVGAVLTGQGLPKADDVRVFDTPIHQQIQQFTRDLGKVARLAQGRGQVTPALRGGLDAAGRLFGVPPPSLVRSVDGAYKVAKYRLLGPEHNDFRGATPVTPIGDIGKVVIGDNDKYESNIYSEFDSLWRQ